MPSLFKMISHFCHFYDLVQNQHRFARLCRLFETRAHRGQAAMIFVEKRGVFTGDGAFSPAHPGCQLGIVRDGWTSDVGTPGAVRPSSAASIRRISSRNLAASSNSRLAAASFILASRSLITFWKLFPTKSPALAPATGVR